MAANDDNNSSSSPSVTLTSNGSNKFCNTRRSSIRSFESYDSVGSFASSYNIPITNLSSSSSSRNSSIPQESTSQQHNQENGSEKISSLLNVAEMLLHGVADNEIIRTWLSSIGCEEYSNKFIDSGYDMSTLSRMTPQDLTAIGITNPTQRNKIQAEIKKLNLQDGIPNFKPPDLEQWLRLLRLDGFYYKTLCDQHYNTIERVCQLTWEDFEEIGIQKLGHQKRLLLAIERIKEIEATSKVNTASEPIYDTSPNQILLINGKRAHQNLTKQQHHSHYGIYDTQTLYRYLPYQQTQSCIGNLYATITRQHGKKPPPVPVRTNSLRSTTSIYRHNHIHNHNHNQNSNQIDNANTNPSSNNNNIIYNSNFSITKGHDEDFPPPPSPLPPMDFDEDEQPSPFNDNFSLMSITSETTLSPNKVFWNC